MGVFLELLEGVGVVCEEKVGVDVRQQETAASVVCIVSLLVVGSLWSQFGDRVRGRQVQGKIRKGTRQKAEGGRGRR